MPFVYAPSKTLEVNLLDNEVLGLHLTNGHAYAPQPHFVELSKCKNVENWCHGY